jgi:hypothetical protein
MMPFLGGVSGVNLLAVQAYFSKSVTGYAGCSAISSHRTAKTMI